MQRDVSANLHPPKPKILSILSKEKLYHVGNETMENLRIFLQFKEEESTMIRCHKILTCEKLLMVSNHKHRAGTAECPALTATE